MMLTFNQEYLTDVAQENKLYQVARFNSSVQKMEWKDDETKWHVTISVDGGKDAEYGSSYEVVSDFVISAIGQLCKPKGFDIPGLSNFQGKVMHSARWDKGFDIANKHVAIVGTGKWTTNAMFYLADPSRCDCSTDYSRNRQICSTFDSMPENSWICHSPP